MSEPVQIGRRALLKGAVGLAGATIGRPAWAETQANRATHRAAATATASASR